MISWITRVILSTPRRSTSARAPWFSAIIRFWINVESLNRPPTLLTISSSFSSSIISAPVSTMVLNQDGGQCVNRSIKIIIDYMKIIVLCELELAASVLEAAADGRFIVGSPGTEPVLEYVHVRHLDENEQGVGNFPSDLK